MTATQTLPKRDPYLGDGYNSLTTLEERHQVLGKRYVHAIQLLADVLNRVCQFEHAPGADVEAAAPILVDDVRELRDEARLARFVVGGEKGGFVVQHTSGDGEEDA